MVLFPIFLPKSVFVRDSPQIRSHTEYLFQCGTLLDICTDLSEFFIFVLWYGDLTVYIIVFFVHVFDLVSPVFDAHGRFDVGMVSIVVKEVGVFDVCPLLEFDTCMGVRVSVCMGFIADLDSTFLLEFGVQEAVECWFVELVMSVREEHALPLESEVVHGLIWFDLVCGRRRRRPP